MANDQLVIFKYVSGARRKGYMQRKRQLVIVIPIFALVQFNGY